MKKFTLIVLFCTQSELAFAQAGNIGGGGDELKRSFVSLSVHLLNTHFRDQPELREKLFAVLQSPKTKIVSVPVLSDVVTNQDIPNQKTLVAWGSPGLIQLKQLSDDPKDISLESLSRDNKPIAHYLIHELFRAGQFFDKQGRCIDENYEISIMKLHLDQLPLHFDNFSKNDQAVKQQTMNDLDGKSEAVSADHIFYPKSGTFMLNFKKMTITFDPFQLPEQGCSRLENAKYLKSSGGIPFPKGLGVVVEGIRYQIDRIWCAYSSSVPILRKNAFGVEKSLDVGNKSHTLWITAQTKENRTEEGYSHIFFSANYDESLSRYPNGDWVVTSTNYSSSLRSREFEGMVRVSLDNITVQSKPHHSGY